MDKLPSATECFRNSVEALREADRMIKSGVESGVQWGGVMMAAARSKAAIAGEWRGLAEIADAITESSNFSESLESIIETLSSKGPEKDIDDPGSSS